MCTVLRTKTDENKLAYKEVGEFVLPLYKYNTGTAVRNSAKHY